MLRPTLWLVTLCLCACQTSPYPLEVHPSENTNDRVRFLVMHYTAINFDRSLRALTQASDRPVSSHYLVPESNDPSYPHKDLRVYQLVDESKRAWHAGASRWEDREALNDQSIGIEIVNLAHCHPPMETGTDSLCFFPDFDPTQMQLVAQLAEDILLRYPDITPTRVVGHGDIQPFRKNDPGPRFPWQWLAAQGIGAWPDDDTVLTHYRALEAAPAPVLNEWVNKPDPEDSNPLPDPTPHERQFAHWLAAYGYGIEPCDANVYEIQRYTRAFQYHFRQHKADGLSDLHTRALVMALLEKYWPEADLEAFQADGKHACVND